MSNRDYKHLPKDIKPISAWGYFWMNVLFCIPFIGLVCLIAFCFSDKNIHRRNYARSFLIPFFISIALIIGIFVLLIATGSLSEFVEAYNEVWSEYYYNPQFPVI